LESQIGSRIKQDITPPIKVEVVIPTLNEAENIKELIIDLSNLRLPVALSALVIDGGSSDGTVEICKKANMKVLRQRGRGKGSAMREAVDFSQADIIVFIDGDTTYSIAEMGSLLQPLLAGEADIVLGSRILGKREKGSISTFNIIGNKLFNAAINFSMKSKITDSLSGYRAMYREIFLELVLLSESFEVEVEMMVEALARHYRVAEVPVSYKKRRNGSKTKLKPVDDGVQIGKTLLFILMNINPLKFFGILSLAFIAIGMYPALFVINEKITTDAIVSMPSVVFASLLFMMGAICLVIGILSELMVASRRRLEAIILRKQNRKI
jgi:dolichol-phosphate mannosyltransferase